MSTMSDKTGLYGLPLPETPEKPPGKRRWWIRVPIIIAIVLYVSLMVLSRIGGSSDTLRSGLEGYLNDATGLTAHIGKLIDARFYPEQKVDVENVSLYESAGGGGSSVVTVGKASIATGFWSNMSGRTGYRVMDLRNARIAPGVLLPQELRIERAGIQADDPAKPLFVIRGEYGGKPVDGTVLLSSKKTRSGKVEYRLADQAPFEFTMGPVAGEGVLDLATGQGLVAKFETLKIGDAQTITGTIAFLQQLSSKTFKGSFLYGDSKASFDLKLAARNDTVTMTGMVTFDALDVDSMLGKRGITNLVQTLRVFVLGAAEAKDREKRPYDMRLMDVDVNIVIKSLLAGGQSMGHLEFPVKETENHMTFGPVTGAIKGGATEGLVEVDARSVPARMKSNILIRGLEYAPENDGGGHADVKIEVSSEGNSTGALWHAMTGRAMIVAGRGVIASNLVSLWGGGFLGTILASAENADGMVLNCGIADFKIDGTVAKLGTLLLDANKVTIVGDGSVNFGKGTVNLRLDPESKDHASLPEVRNVSVNGPWNKPSIVPADFSLMTRFGALFLGTVNPDTLAFSLADLGVPEQHPCQGYMKK